MNKKFFKKIGAQGAPNYPSMSAKVGRLIFGGPQAHYFFVISSYKTLKSPISYDIVHRRRFPLGFTVKLIKHFRNTCVIHCYVKDDPTVLHLACSQVRSMSTHTVLDTSGSFEPSGSPIRSDPLKSTHQSILLRELCRMTARVRINPFPSLKSTVFMQHLHMNTKPHVYLI